MGGAPTHPQQLKPHSPQFSSPHHHRRRRHHRGLHHFPKGSSVEVQTDEEDYRGVYFSATVISTRSIPQKKGTKKTYKKLFVEYRDLLAREDGSDRLRENVDFSFVRPAPPFQETVEDFEPDDVVDAFYKDGWWTGVVKRVVQRGKRFVLSFQHPPDELEFGLEELRAHWDWVDGCWVRPVKQITIGVMFDAGRKVEVSFDREGLQDAWFPATILEDLGDGAFQVEYFRSDFEGKAQSVKVTINSRHVRPCPPLLKGNNFALLEKVDAFFDFGWWSGIITKVLENSKYIVFFKQTKRQKEFHQNELRPLMEWKEGRWFTSSQDVSTASLDDGMHEQHTPENPSGSALAGSDNSLDDTEGTSPLNSSTDKSEQLTTPVNKINSRATSLKKRRQRLSDSRHALSQPLKRLKEGNTTGASQQVKRGSLGREMLSGSLSPVSLRAMKASATQTAKGNHSSDKTSWGRRSRRNQKEVGSARNAREVNFKSGSMKKSSMQALQHENPELDHGGKKPDAVGNSAEDVQNEHAKNKTERRVIIGLPCAEMGSSEFGRSRDKRGRPSNNKGILKLAADQKQQLLRDSTNKETQDQNQVKTAEFMEKRKRGRPRKIPTTNTETPATGNGQGSAGSHDLSNGDPLLSPEIVVTRTTPSLPDQDEIALNHDKQTTNADATNGKQRMTKRTFAKMLNENAVKDSTGLQENRSKTRGRRNITGEKIAPQAQDSVEASGGQMMDLNRTVEVEKTVADAPCNEIDDEPLSKWIGGLNSPSIIDGPRLSPVSAMEQCIKNSERQNDAAVLHENTRKQLESVLPASALLDKSSLLPSEQQDLPFVKNTVLWRTVESMEVFKRIPQQPHFKPLEQFKESLREGIAVGYMVTFSSVVEKVSKLQINDPKSVIDDIKETLADLERHGFDVRVVQDRVTELLAVKEKQGKLVDEVNVLKNQISEHTHSKGRIEEEIQDINEQIRELQEKLSLVESEKVKEDGEIAILQARVREMEESMKNLGSDKGGIAFPMS